MKIESAALFLFFSCSLSQSLVLADSLCDVLDRDEAGGEGEKTERTKNAEEAICIVRSTSATKTFFFFCRFDLLFLCHFYLVFSPLLPPFSLCRILRSRPRPPLKLTLPLSPSKLNSTQKLKKKKKKQASDKCQREKRKTINGDDLLWALSTLGFECYVDPLKAYLAKYRESEKNAMAAAGGGGGGGGGSKDGARASAERGDTE